MSHLLDCPKNVSESIARFATLRISYLKSLRDDVNASIVSSY